MKYLSNTIGSNLDKKVIFSTDDNPFYYFFMPIVSKLWIKMDYQPQIVIVGNTNQWNTNCQKQLVLNSSLSSGANVLILDTEMIQKTREFDGYNPSAIAQIARLCSPCWPEAKDSDYYLTSDIDMLPLQPSYFRQQNFSRPIHIFYANGYNHSRYAICYLGMDVSFWKKVIMIERPNIYVELMKILAELKRYSPREEQWGHDESFFFRRIKNFSGYPQICQMLDRKVYKNSSKDGGGGGIPATLPIDRLDRSNWNFSGNISHYVDAHCLRPGYSIAYWNKIRHLLQFVFDPDDLVWVDNYYKEFDKCLKL